MKRVFTCIICPKGCEIEADIDGEKIELTGYSCVRGRKYAEAEVTNPVRTLTTTVRLKSGAMLPVRSDAPVPKSMLFECMNAVREIDLPDGLVKAGDIVLDNICGMGAKLIACADGE